MTLTDALTYLSDLQVSTVIYALGIWFTLPCLALAGWVALHRSR